MESEYVIRKATINDANFLADVIIGAEKSLTENLGLANFFELTEEEVKELIIKMLEEEVDGCDFSISSFFIPDLPILLPRYAMRLVFSAPSMPMRPSRRAVWTIICG